MTLTVGHLDPARASKAGICTEEAKMTRTSAWLEQYSTASGPTLFGRMEISPNIAIELKIGMFT
jgi:hypothetical protein